VLDSVRLQPCCSTTPAPFSGYTTHNITGKSAKLDSLQDNGGLTYSQDLLPGSPLLNAANPAGCKGPDGAALTTDQRVISAPSAAVRYWRCRTSGPTYLRCAAAVNRWQPGYLIKPVAKLAI